MRLAFALYASALMATLPVSLNVLAAHQTALHLPPSHLDAQNALFSPSTSLPVPNATVSYWMHYLDADHKPSPTEGSTGELTKDADVCIIGSGITGVSAAYHLSKLVENGFRRGVDGDPLKVVILEAREFCSGATGRNGGHLTPHAFSHFTTLSKLFGASEAKRSLELERRVSSQVRSILNETGKTDDVDFVSGGRVRLLFTKEEEEIARTEYEAAKDAGIELGDVVWLTKEQVYKRYGASYPAVVTPGNNVWPLKLVSHLYNLAANSSPNFDLTVHTHAPVTTISERPSSQAEHGWRKWSLHTPRGSVSCSTILHATNGYAAHLLPFMYGEIVPTRGQIITVRSNVSQPFGMGREGFIGNDGFEYWFPRPKKTAGENELVVIGGGREAAKDGKFEFYETNDGSVNEHVGEVVRAFLPAVFPGRFDGTEPEMEWTGIMGYTKSGEPFVGPVINEDARKYVGQYISAGYTGHGMPRAFACAEAVAGMILAELKEEEWSCPEWFPEHYLTTNRARDISKKAK